MDFDFAAPRVTVRTGNFRADVATFLLAHDCPKTAAHCVAVAAKAVELARLWSRDEGFVGQAELAGLLHDVSAVIPNSQRVACAEAWGVPLLNEERAFPMIVHQKLSARLARDVFDVRDEAVLSAIGCHTTLKPAASALDKIVFVADKIAWDQDGRPPYIVELLNVIDRQRRASDATEHERNLDAAALVYLNFLWDNRAALKCVHPWFVAARAELLNS